MSAPAVPGLPHVLRDQAAATPDAVALRRKRLGIWQPVSFAALHARVARVALGLQGLGVAAGDAVAVVGDISVEWIATDLATQALGARSVTPWHRLTAEALQEDLRRAGVRVVVCGDQEQADKLVEADDEFVVVVVDTTGMRGAGYAHTLADLEAAAGTADGYGALLDARRPEDEVSVAFEPGRPRRAVVHRADALVAAAGAAAALSQLGPKDRTLCLLPPAALAARVFDLYAALVAGASSHLPENPASSGTDLEEVHPTVLSASPRALELLRAHAQLRAARSGRFKRRLVQRTLGGNGGGAGRALVLRPMARRMGVGSVRRIAVLGGPVTDDMRSFFAGLGPEVVVVEGPLVAAGMAFADAQALPGVEARVGEDRTLAVRTPWSGDALPGDGIRPLLAAAGSEGRIEVLGGLDDVDGDVVLPALEARLRDSPYITEAVVSAAAGAPAARVGLDVEAVGVWAAEHDVYAATRSALAEHPRVVNLVETEAIRLLGEGTIGAITVMARRLLEEEGELDAMLGVQRDSSEPMPA